MRNVVTVKLTFCVVVMHYFNPKVFTECTPQ